MHQREDRNKILNKYKFNLQTYLSAKYYL